MAEVECDSRALPTVEFLSPSGALGCELRYTACASDVEAAATAAATAGGGSGKRLSSEQVEAVLVRILARGVGQFVDEALYHKSECVVSRRPPGAHRNPAFEHGL